MSGDTPPGFVPSIRAAEAADAAAVAAIYEPYVRDTAVSFEIEPPSTVTMANRLAGTTATHPWLVAEHDGTIAGFAYAAKHSEREAYRWTVDVTVYVNREMRRRAIGRGLYQVLLEVLRRQGFHSAFAEIVLPNPGSVRLHESAGFKLIGVHKQVGFKLGCWHDIGYWCIGLDTGSSSPHKPIPFAEFRQNPEFAAALLQARPDGMPARR